MSLITQPRTYRRRCLEQSCRSRRCSLPNVSAISSVSFVQHSLIPFVRPVRLRSHSANPIPQISTLDLLTPRSARCSLSASGKSSLIQRPKNSLGVPQLTVASQTTICGGTTANSSVPIKLPLDLLHGGVVNVSPSISDSLPAGSYSFDIKRDLSQQSSASSRSKACRRSLNASTSPIMTQRNRSPCRSVLASGSISENVPRSMPLGVPLRFDFY
ncbi:hypothetical protein AB6A40_000973 [Gnathostoma spinigerum]|uniref:Uncharacterized protein n=1 Tax=Gnathostoma spinigerum TaxID=75299 RepID=A0ABD6E355_9BILA